MPPVERTDFFTRFVFYGPADFCRFGSSGRTRVQSGFSCRGSGSMSGSRRGVRSGIVFLDGGDEGLRIYSRIDHFAVDGERGEVLDVGDGFFVGVG